MSTPVSSSWPATNSAKMAQFARAVADAGIHFGSVAECVEAAIAGRWQPGGTEH